MNLFKCIAPLVLVASLGACAFPTAAPTTPGVTATTSVPAIKLPIPLPSLTVLPSPAVLATSICPSVQAAISALGLPGVLNASETLLLQNPVTPEVNAVCSGATTLNISSLQSFNSTAYPTLLTIIQDSTIPTATKSGIILGMTMAYPILTALVAQVSAMQAATGAPVSTTVTVNGVPAAVVVPAPSTLASTVK